MKNATTAAPLQQPPNGKPVTPPEKPTAPNPADAPAVKIETPAPAAQEQAPKAPSLPEIMAKIEDKFEIVKKWEQLQTTKKELESFRLGTEGLKDTLVISDGAYHKFQTYNSDVIIEVLQVIKDNVNRKIAQTEKELIA